MEDSQRSITVEAVEDTIDGTAKEGEKRNHTDLTNSYTAYTDDQKTLVLNFLKVKLLFLAARVGQRTGNY